MWCSESRWQSILLSATLAFAAAAGRGDVVASVGDAAIQRRDVDAFLSRLGGAAGGEEADRQRARAAVLEQLIDEQILRGELAGAGVAVEPAAVEAAIDRLRQQAKAQGKELEAALAASGRSIEALQEQVALELAVEAFVRPRMTDAAIKRIFEANRRELDGTLLRVSHIVLRPDGIGNDVGEELRKRAATIRSEIVQGRMSFADAAKQFSAGPSRRQGGDLGWIGPEAPMLKTFTSEVYPLAKGGITQPFLTAFGVHIATVTAVEPGRIGLAQVRGRVEKLLASELVRGLVTEGRGKTPISIAPGVPHFDPATLGQPIASRPVLVRKADE